MRKPIIVQYEDLETLVKSAYRIKSPEPLTGWMPEPIHFVTGTGRRLKKRKYHVTWAEYLKRIRERNKVWGYTNGSTSGKIVIRYWISEDATDRDIVEFFAHELGHHTGRSYSNTRLEEAKAVTYERVGVLAYDIMKMIREEGIGYNRKKKGNK